MSSSNEFREASRTILVPEMSAMRSDPFLPAYPCGVAPSIYLDAQQWFTKEEWIECILPILGTQSFITIKGGSLHNLLYWARLTMHSIGI